MLVLTPTPNIGHKLHGLPDVTIVEILHRLHSQWMRVDAFVGLGVHFLEVCWSVFLTCLFLQNLEVMFGELCFLLILLLKIVKVCVSASLIVCLVKLAHSMQQSFPAIILIFCSQHCRAE